MWMHNLTINFIFSLIYYFSLCIVFLGGLKIVPYDGWHIASQQQRKQQSTEWRWKHFSGSLTQVVTKLAGQA